jgi:hypothetical protein
MIAEANFYEYTPEEFTKLDLTQYSPECLREMAYFIWSMYQDEAGLMEWRTRRLIPLLQIDDLVYTSEDD